MSTRTRVFTRLDADTWDALIAHALRVKDRGWSVTMSNKDLGALLGMNRRTASFRAKRLLDFGMVTAIYGDVNGRPSAKVYKIDNKWLGKSPEVGDYYDVEVD